MQMYNVAADRNRKATPVNQYWWGHALAWHRQHRPPSTPRKPQQALMRNPVNCNERLWAPANGQYQIGTVTEHLSLSIKSGHATQPGAQFTKYLTIYRKFILRSTYDSDLKRAKIYFRNIVS